MRTRTILTLCGMAMGAALSTAAVAQQQHPQPGDTTRTDKDRTQPGAGAITTRAEGIPAPMRALDGVWRVEIQLTPKYWELDKGMKDHSKPDLNRPDSNRPDANKPDPNRPDTSGKPSNTPPGSIPPGTTPGNENQPGKEGRPSSTDRDRQPGMSDSTGMQTTTGFAETRFTLGSSAFEQNIVIPDFAGIVGDKPGLSTQPGPFRGVMLMTFDNTARSYDVAFTCNKKPKIHTHSGSYDVSGNRVLFNVNESMGMKDTNRRDDTTGRPGGAESRMTTQSKNPQVILEVLSPTQYRISMYINDTGTPSSTPSTQPGRDTTNPNRDTTNPGRDTNQPGRDTARPGIGTGEPNGTLVYRATYTKAEGADQQNFRRIIQENGSGGVTQVPDSTRP